jgi:hypothetical protein
MRRRSTNRTFAGDLGVSTGFGRLLDDRAKQVRRIAKDRERVFPLMPILLQGVAQTGPRFW